MSPQTRLFVLSTRTRRFIERVSRNPRSRKLAFEATERQLAFFGLSGYACVIIVADRHVTIGRIIRGRHGAKEPGRLHARTTCRRSPESGVVRNRLLDPRRKNPRTPRVGSSRSRRRSAPQKEKGLSGVLGALIVAATSAAGRRYLPRCRQPTLRRSPIFALRASLAHGSGALGFAHHGRIGLRRHATSPGTPFIALARPRRFVCWRAAPRTLF